MSKAERIKKAHIKRVNELLDEGFKKQDPKERPVVLKPSNNVTKSSKSFLDKMNLLNNVG